MRVLVLGNSNDSGNWFEGGPKRTEILRDRLAAEFGEPVTVTTRSIWPNERMVELIERWLDECEPDLVYMNVLTYWYAYESVPLKLRRLLGRHLGPVVGDAGVRLSKSRRWGHNLVGRTVRRWAQATIGGDPNFATTAVIERCSDAIGTIVQREGIVLMVKGGRGRSKPGLTPRQRARYEVRRLEVHRAMSALCVQKHVRYMGSEEPLWKTEPPRPRGTRVGDGLHSNAKGHASSADRMHGFIREAWAEHLAELEPAGVR
jgi:hypothetical protein